MIVVVNAESRRFFEADLVQMYRQRKSVFVDGARWNIPVIGDMEVDAYDRNDTIYLLAKDYPDWHVHASVRLLTTTGPHLMCDLFDAMDRARIPRGPTVWEVSRFCTDPGILARDRRHALLWEVICGVLETGLLYGIEEVVFAAGRALLPLALRGGWEVRTLVRSRNHPNEEVTAVAAAITTTGLHRARHIHGVSTPAIGFTGNAPHQVPYQFRPFPAVDEQRTSPLSLGQVAPVHQHIHSTGDLAHG